MTSATEQLSTSCAEQSAICCSEYRSNADTRISGFQSRRQTMRCPASKMQLQPAAATVGTKLSFMRQVALCSSQAHARTAIGVSCQSGTVRQIEISELKPPKIPTINVVFIQCRFARVCFARGLLVGAFLLKAQFTKLDPTNARCRVSLIFLNLS